MKSVRRSLPVACETVQSVPASSVAVGRQALLFTAFGSQDRQDDVDDDPPVDETLCRERWEPRNCVVSANGTVICHSTSRSASHRSP